MFVCFFPKKRSDHDIDMKSFFVGKLFHSGGSSFGSKTSLFVHCSRENAHRRERWPSKKEMGTPKTSGLVF